MRNAATTAARVQAAMTASPDFMALGRHLKEAGIRYRFSTEAPMPPCYLITIGGGTWFVVNEQHADDGSFTVNGMGLTR